MRRRAQGQGVVFGQNAGIQPREGGYIARDNMAASGSGNADNDVSQRDLANHLEQLASLPAQRLDGEEWGELVITPEDYIEQVFEIRSSPRQTSITDIPVRNDYNTFAPFRCQFVSTTTGDFTVTPNHGSMNRRSGEPTVVTVRYTPQSVGEVHEALLVFETEDMKKIYKFIGST